MKKKKLSSGKIAFIVFGGIAFLFAFVIAYLVVADLKQENLLKQEIINVSNKDLLTDNYSVEVKTTGDYAYIEEAVKKYYKNLSDNIKVINSYLNDEELINILSYENISSDGPKFIKSYETLSKTKDKTSKSLNNIIDLCKEDTIKKLIDKDKVDDYTYDLYLTLMYTDEDKKKLEEAKTEIQEISDNLNVFLDKVKVMLDLLNQNSDYWFVKDGQLYFETDALVAKYNKLHDELNKFVKDKFSKYENNNDSANDKNNI